MGELIDFDTLTHTNGAAPLGASPPPRLRAIGLHDFLKMDFPPRRMLLAPWLPMGGLAMLFAPRGVGKTHIALEVAYAVATASSVLRWHAPEPHPVLIIDGEMPAGTLQERLTCISNRQGVEPPSPDYLRIVASDLHSDGLPDLSDPTCQCRYDDVLGDAKLIIVDNLSTLLPVRSRQRRRVLDAGAGVGSCPPAGGASGPVRAPCGKGWPAARHFPQGGRAR
jgi:hypothetical protein